MGLDVDYILKEKGLSRSKLADLLGSNRSYVTNILKNPTVETLEKVALALEVDIKDLFGDKHSLLNGFVEYDNTIYSIKSKEDLEELLTIMNSERG